MPTITKAPTHGDGNKDADIMFIGDVPITSSRQILTSTLQQVGILPNKCFFTSAIHFPRSNAASFIKLTSRKGVNEKTKALLTSDLAIDSVQQLFHEIAYVKPNIIVPLGNTALWLLTGLTRIDKRRGSLLQATWDAARDEVFKHKIDPRLIEYVKGTKVYPTYDPSMIQRKMNLLGVLHYDLTQILEESVHDKYTIPTPKLIIDPPLDEARRLTEELLSSQLISYDIEVIGGDTLFCVGFAHTTEWAVTFSAATDGRYDEFIQRLLESDVPKLAQNGIFDKTWLRRFTKYRVGGEQHDTLVSHAIVYPEYPKGLDFIGSLYTRFPYHKDEGKNWNPRDAADVQRFLEYNAKDVLVTLAAYQQMLSDELKDPDHWSTYRRIMSQQPVYEEMMEHGIQLDVAEMTNLKNEHKREIAESQRELDAHVKQTLSDLGAKVKSDKDIKRLLNFKELFDKGYGTPTGGLNVNSTKLLRIWLYEILKLPKKTRRGSNVTTTNETALKALYAETKDPSLLLIWKIREKRKRLSSYLNIKHNSSGRTYFSVMPVKTKTGRSATGKTILGEGINVQTPPHDLRTIFIPDDPAFEFGYFDLAQAEARIVAYAGGISRMIQAFETGEDLHRLTASLILGIPFDEVEEYPHRYLGKRCNHAFNYEMGPYKFHDVINDDATDTGISITRAEAKKLRQAHLRAYPELAFYWDEIRAQLRKNRTIINPFNRKRVFNGRLDASTFREAFSFYPQSTVADILRTGMLAVQQWILNKSVQARITLEVHDALLVQYPKADRDIVVPKILSLMRVPFTIKGQEIVIPTDAQIGPNWQDLTKYVPTASR